MLGDEYEVDVY